MPHHPEHNQTTMRVARDGVLDEQLGALRRRLIREASQAIEILKSSVDALWDLDHSSASMIADIEREIDHEEVRIEQECYRILTLKNPFAADFRLITFCLKVNSDIERVADHAFSITKITGKLEPPAPEWPPSLREMGERIPMMCERLLRAVVNTDVELARKVVLDDKAIDKLDRQAFREISERLQHDPSSADASLLMYRVTRELERVGDLLGDIAEGVIYLQTGTIVRHAPALRADNRRPAS